eukprot:TRINITY_DN20100_c0_g1_i2.p1 TRINITY_DN20100_c0_g1~~TRINITY_DN20100_c0_g1_i2.p1  ORF type:complete len:125 (-),score=15.24 TRINITY_DN20100_c0_g1_i2:23-397(-)
MGKINKIASEVKRLSEVKKSKEEKKGRGGISQSWISSILPFQRVAKMVLTPFVYEQKTIRSGRNSGTKNVALKIGPLWNRANLLKTSRTITLTLDTYLLLRRRTELCVEADGHTPGVLQRAITL